MTEQQAEAAAATETAEDTQQQADDKLKPTETVEFWKQKAREQEKRAKDNATAASKLKEFEDRDKSEAQRLAERAEAAEKAVVEAETRALRLEIATEKGLSAAQAKRLVGTTREELEADATELLDTFKPPADDRQQVAADLDLGTRGTTSAKGDPAADFAKFLNAQRR